MSVRLFDLNTVLQRHFNWTGFGKEKSVTLENFEVVPGHWTRLPANAIRAHADTVREGFAAPDTPNTGNTELTGTDLNTDLTLALRRLAWEMGASERHRQNE